jgi:transcription antitermination protein NusB
VATRRDARRLAIDILYQADITATDPNVVLRGWSEAGRPAPRFASELVEGVADHEPEIDLLLEEHAEEWTVARMTALDRTILRVAVFELLHRPDVPPSAAISEAVEAAAELSAEDAKRFVNGVLGRIARELLGDRPT